MSALHALADAGQSIWFDYIRRSLIESGELAAIVGDGITGLTSNPAIFENAIAGSTDYDAALRADIAEDRDAAPAARFERLAVADIRNAADVLRDVYETTDGADGFVSLEVSPHLAHDTESTIAEARRLWTLVHRPNLMIKVPGTPEGVPAIETLIADGINVNVTLLFALDQYEAAAEAYLRGLERTGDPARVASVASFFVSRVDTAVDRLLDGLGTQEATELRGTIAVANAKLAYARYRELFESERFARLAARGARPQRVLWASTGTKDPAYSDVLYVEELVGPNTVNTAPPATIEAFREHGRVRGATLLDDLTGARSAIDALSGLGIDLAAVTDRLTADGVKAFADAHDRLLSALEEKTAVLRATAESRQEMALGEYAPAVAGRLDVWHRAGVTSRLFEGDPTLWTEEPKPEVADRLGWLTLPATMRPQLAALASFADEVRRDGIRDVVLLGMGGSSLAPEMYQAVFGNAPGRPRLTVLDSTHPVAVRRVGDAVDLDAVLFLVASKSGTTVETLSFFRYFWERMARRSGEPGRHFAAITDPGTPLVALARDHGFRRVFAADPEVGGRYSALTHFGLVPAALIGAPTDGLLDRAAEIAETIDPALALGAALGELAIAGRNKATLLASPSLDALPAWLEQLIAESTGKEGTGILPVANEPVGPPEVYGEDRVFVYFALRGDSDTAQAAAVDTIEAAGHPVIRITVDEAAGLGSEIYRAEAATAMAGAVLRINPFDQPDVQHAKELAGEAMEGRGDEGAIPETAADDAAALSAAVQELLSVVRPGDYLAIQAFIAPSPGAEASLQRGRVAVRNRLRIATTLGFGPRFLHSTGQFHKGGTNVGVFLQVVDHAAPDLAVPDTDYGFGGLIAAQADGDYRALVAGGRRVLRVCVGDEAAGGAERLAEALGA
jgi:transaldolase/glucose-6-phosphate isomerase